MKKKLLRIEAPYFTAGAIWERGAKDWLCVEAAPIIKWMIGKPALETKAYLDSKGWRYEWVELKEAASNGGLL